MNPLRAVSACYIFFASFHAAAYDAAQCAQLQGNLRKLDAYIAGSPTASDRQRFMEARTAQAALLPRVCGGGATGAGSSPGSVSRAPGSGALPSVMGNILGALPPPGAYQVPAPPDGPPAPPTPSGSVQGPMTMQRLPGSAAPTVHAMEAPTASGFPTDEQIARDCAGSPNPSSCALVRENERNRNPEYQRWKAAESDRMQRNIDRSLDNINRALAAEGQATTPGVIPVAPPPMPYDNSDPDLAKCREGSKEPWTIAGCYDLAKTRPSAKQAPAKATELRDRLRRARADQDTARSPVAEPSRDFDNERKQAAEWKQRAQVRLAEAIGKGAVFVPEDKAARQACDGWWIYDGLSAGRCDPGRIRIVYAVDQPVQPQAAPAEEEGPTARAPFYMDPAETEREIRRLIGGIK